MRCHSLSTSKLLHSSYCPSILSFLFHPGYQPLLSVSPTPLPGPCSASLAYYLLVQLYWRTSQKLYCISSLIPPCILLPLVLCALYPLCKRPISWGIVSSYLSCPDQLSSLSKSLQFCLYLPCPVWKAWRSPGGCWPCSWCWCHHGALCCLPWRPWGCGEDKKQPSPVIHSKELPVSAELKPWHGSMLPGAPLLTLGARGDSLKAGGSHVFRDVHRHREWMVLYGTASSCCCLHPCPCDILQLSKCWFAFLPVSDCHICAADSFCSLSSTWLQWSSWSHLLMLLLLFFFTLVPLSEMSSSYQSYFKVLVIHFFAVPSPRHDSHFSASFLSWFDLLSFPPH